MTINSCPLRGRLYSQAAPGARKGGLPSGSIPHAIIACGLSALSGEARDTSPRSPQAQLTRPWLAALRPQPPASIALAPSPVSPTGKGSGRGLTPALTANMEDTK